MKTQVMRNLHVKYESLNPCPRSKDTAKVKVFESRLKSKVTKLKALVPNEKPGHKDYQSPTSLDSLDTVKIKVFPLKCDAETVALRIFLPVS